MKKIFVVLLSIFISWRLLLSLFGLISTKILPLQYNFLGGGYDTYITSPLFWFNFNFDGDHFLAIAKDGYLPLTYFFFPILPLITRMLALSISFAGNLTQIAATGLVLTNISSFVALLGLYKLLILDLNKSQVWKTIFILLIFPTSFYLGAYYSEGLFLALAVWAFYFARNKKWVYAIVLASIASATRLVGIALAAGLVAEYVFMDKKLKYPTPLKVAAGIGLGTLSLSGLWGYMYYLYIKTGGPLEFFNNVSIFGDQRSSKLILLPQVFYRYFFKILPNINYDYFPVVFTTYLEISTALIVGLTLLIMLFKLRSGYFVYSFMAYIIPTLSGSFSSLPRYVLVIFPTFIIFNNIINKLSKRSVIGLMILSILCLFIASSLFYRGYWVS